MPNIGSLLRMILGNTYGDSLGSPQNRDGGFAGGGGGLREARINPNLGGGVNPNLGGVETGQSQSHWKTCPTCGGTGKVPDVEAMMGGLRGQGGQSNSWFGGGGLG